MSQDDNATKQQVRNWVNKFVLDLELCPFARKEVELDTLRYNVSNELDFEQILDHLQQELELLKNSSQIETTLLILSDGLSNFDEFLDFVDLANQFLAETDLESVFQLASFHPHYQFEGTSLDAAENFTNRAPFPVIHILREQSVSDAVSNHSDLDKLAHRNIEKMNTLGREKLQALLSEC